MREQEMRMRVVRFLKIRMRNAILPATVGIGLAVGMCEGAKGGALHGTDSFGCISRSYAAGCSHLRRFLPRLGPQLEH